MNIKKLAIVIIFLCFGLLGCTANQKKEIPEPNNKMKNRKQKMVTVLKMKKQKTRPVKMMANRPVKI